jgi:hypothetical protein
MAFFAREGWTHDADINPLAFCSEQKDKEDLEEVSTELELADEDELVPYVSYALLLGLAYARPISCR